jgi:hypothetical protein
VADLESIDDEIPLLHVQCWNQTGEQFGDTITDDRKIDLVNKKMKSVTEKVDGQPAKAFEAETVLAADGAAIVVVDQNAPVWIKLEGDIQIHFPPGKYQVGDYWLIRTSALTPSGFVGLAPDRDSKGNIKSFQVPLSGYRHRARLFEISNDQNTLKFESVEWKQLRLVYEDKPKPRTGCEPCQCKPLDVPDKPVADSSTQPAAETNPSTPGTPPPADNPPAPTPADPGEVLSTEGAEALSRYFPARRDLARHVPARYLNHDPQSPEYRRFRAALLVSDILEPTFEQYLAKVERCLPATESWEAVASDARRDYELAVDFRRLIAPNSASAVLT